MSTNAFQMVWKSSKRLLDQSQKLIKEKFMNPFEAYWSSPIEGKIKTLRQQTTFRIIDNNFRVVSFDQKHF